MNPHPKILQVLKPMGYCIIAGNSYNVIRAPFFNGKSNPAMMSDAKLLNSAEHHNNL